MSLADLNFEKGQAFEAEVWRKWGVRTNSEAGSTPENFPLVAEFTQSKIRLTPESVGTILLSCFGGRASLFRVQQLQNWSFKFSVSSKEVGFTIIKGGNISVPEFNLSFLLWGSGGPNSSYELDQYLQEKEDEWTHVFRNHPRKSYAQAVQSPSTYLAPTRSHSRSHPHSLNGGAVSARDRMQHSMVTNVAGNQAVQIPGQSFSSLNPKDQPNQCGSPFCVRCLMFGHAWPACTNKIKCRACKRWGHIAKDCYSAGRPNVSPEHQSSSPNLGSKSLS